MAGLTSILIGYVLAIGFGFGIVGFLQAGYLIPFMNVKMSRGKKVLIRLRKEPQDIFRVGDISEGFLIFKDGKLGERRISLSKLKGRQFKYRSMGVNIVEVDDEKNAILTPNLDGVDGFDAVKYNNYIIRALTRPNLDDKREKIMFVLAIVTVIGIIGLGVLLFAMMGQVETIAAQTQNLGGVIAEAGV